MNTIDEKLNYLIENKSGGGFEMIYGEAHSAFGNQSQISGTVIMKSDGSQRMFCTGNSAGVTSVKLVDLTNVKTILYRMSKKSGLASYGFMISNNPYYWTQVWTVDSSNQVTVINKPETIQIIDVSNLTGYYYIGYFCGTDTQNADQEYNVSPIYLLKENLILNF